MDRGGCWTAVHGVAKSWTQLSSYHFRFLHFLSYSQITLKILKLPKEIGRFTDKSPRPQWFSIIETERFSIWAYVSWCPSYFLFSFKGAGFTHLHSPDSLATFSVCAKLLQLCLTLCNPADCSPPGSFVHGTVPTRILEWVAVPSVPWDLSDPGMEPSSLTSLALADKFFATSAAWEAQHSVHL